MYIVVRSSQSESSNKFNSSIDGTSQVRVMVSGSLSKIDRLSKIFYKLITEISSTGNSVL